MTDAAPNTDEQQLAARNAAKLGALVGERWGVDAPRTAVGPGAAMVADGQAFVLLHRDPVRVGDEGETATPERPHGLGAALAWARRMSAEETHVILDHPDAGALARQAAAFKAPISIWRSEGRRLLAVDPAPVPAGDGPPDAPELVATLESAGLDVVVEGDRLSGEFRGLEVVRIVRALDDGEPILEVGVGRFDRELTAMMHGDLPDARSVDRVVEQLKIHRTPGSQHPLARLVPERWLRHTLVRDPERVGCSELAPAPTPEPRDRLRTRGVAAALGARDGGTVVVCCTVGVDLDAVVLAADARAALAPEAPLLLALPARDALGVTQALVDDLRVPAELVAVGDDWQT